MLTFGIVVPNFNGARFLADALDSLVEQRDPALRCHVADGGSSDGSVEIARRFAEKHEWITFESGPDGGQAAAIAKSFGVLEGDLLGWLNSDDMLVPGALAALRKAAESTPDAVLFHGDVERIDERGRVIGQTRSTNLDWNRMRRGQARTVQPGSVYRRWAVEAVGNVNPTFHLLMDVDLWIRLTRVGPAKRLPQTLARFRVHDAAKSSQAPWRYYRETARLAWTHQRDEPWRALAGRGLQVARHQARSWLGGK